MLSPRTKALVAMLSSPVDGECLNAARALALALQKDGVDFHDLANGLDRQAASRQRPFDSGEAFYAAPHKAKLAALLALGEDEFRPGEWAFLNNLTSWKGQLTEKQQQWFDDIVRKHKAKAA
jgi:hypothetical protein